VHFGSENTLVRGGLVLTGEGVVTAVHFGELNARGQRSEVDRFEDLLVELLTQSQC